MLSSCVAVFVAAVAVVGVLAILVVAAIVASVTLLRGCGRRRYCQLHRRLCPSITAMVVVTVGVGVVRSCVEVVRHGCDRVTEWGDFGVEFLF
jgi:hypothetical protein